MILKIQNIDKSFGSTPLFKGLSLESKTTVLALIGPSGSGKSSILRLIAGLDLIDQGQIYINGIAIPEEEGPALRAFRKNLGVVFQSWNLFPHLSALSNISLPLQVAHGYTERHAEEKAMELLCRFKLDSHAKKKISQLSGGQNQRVSILRAVAHAPQLLLLDEPTSALDPLMTSEVLDLLAELKNEGSSFIIASHHIPFVKKISQEVVFMADGKILEHTTTEHFFSCPRTQLAKDYVSKIEKYT